MALKFVDGFDFWTAIPGCWTTYNAGQGSNTPTVASSILTIPDAVADSITDSYLRWTFHDNYTTVIVNLRVAFEPNTWFDDVALFTLLDGNDFQMTVGTNSAGQFWVKRSSAEGVQVGALSTFAVVMDGTTFYDVECKILVANSGTAAIRVNGDEVLSVAGDLVAATNEYANNLTLGRTVASGQRPGIKVDHILIMDTSGTSMNDFIGPIKVNPLVILADGNYLDWAPLAGDRWDAINDAAPDTDSTYIESNVVGEKYTAEANNLPAGVTTVHALAVWSHSKRDDDVTRGYKALLRSGTTDLLSTDENFAGPDYAYFINTYDESPFTAVAWTVSEVNGLEVGVQLTT